MPLNSFNNMQFGNIIKSFRYFFREKVRQRFPESSVPEVPLRVFGQAWIRRRNERTIEEIKGYFLIKLLKNWPIDHSKG